MRFLGVAFGGVIIVASCGGTTAPTDGGADGATDGTAADGGPSDSPANDVVQLDAAECKPPNTACATPCPQGTICLKASGPTEIDLGCTTVPPECNGTATCSCMADCFCPTGGLDKCIDGGTYLECNNGAVSRRSFKKDIDYVSDGERATLASETLAMPAAEYRTHVDAVDLYGRASRLLATVQEQQKQIDALKARLTKLERAK